MAGREETLVINSETIEPTNNGMKSKLIASLALSPAVKCFTDVSVVLSIKVYVQESAAHIPRQAVAYVLK